MLPEAIFSLGILSFLFIYYFAEYLRHESNLKQIPLRIHVNGTRGKSSVTRLIAAGLRAGGRKVVAKTTGTQAKIIYPDGSEQALKRRGPANIREMIAVIGQAASLGADTLVTECMAVRPELQWFCEHRMVKSHIGVITNIRADHEDVMGTGVKSVAVSLSNTIPDNGMLVTTPAAEKLLMEAGKIQGSVIITADGGEISQETIRSFPYEVMADNLALALKVCALAEVDPEIALKGMREAAPDTGNITIREFCLGKKQIMFINAFAANDLESTLLLWNRYVGRQEGDNAILLNCRGDRKYRTVQLCAGLVKVHKENYILTGDSNFARNLLLRQGIKPSCIHILPADPGYLELSVVVSKFSHSRLTIFGAGNVQGVQKLIFSRPDGG